MPDDLTTPDALEVIDLPAPNDGDDGTLSMEPVANTAIARWYAIQVASSCEKKVKATLEQRAVTLGVINRILEIEIPQTSPKRRCKRCNVSERKLRRLKMK